jgi:hypothetical protein
MLPFIHVPMAPLQTVAVQARTEARDTHGTDPNDLELEVAPQIRYDAIWARGADHFVALYNPHLIYAAADADSSQNIDANATPLHLQVANVGLEVERQRYHVAAYGNFAYGPVSSSAMLAAFTKPWLGEGLPPSPRVIIPAKFGKVDAATGHITTNVFNLLFGQGQLAVSFYLTRRLTLTPMVNYTAFGGADSDSREPLPMVRGPGASLTLDAKATRLDSFKTKVGAGQAQAFFKANGAGAPFYSAELEERYTHKYSELSQSELAVGASFVNDQFGGSRIFPSAEANSSIGMHTRAVETKFAGVVRVGQWVDIFAGLPEQRAEAILAVNMTFQKALTLRAQGAYARELKDPTVEVSPSYSIVYGEAGLLYRFTRELSTDLSGRYSRQEFSNAQKDGTTNQLLVILGLTYAPHDWKL